MQKPQVPNTSKSWFWAPKLARFLAPKLGLLSENLINSLLPQIRVTSTPPHSYSQNPCDHWFSPLMKPTSKAIWIIGARAQPGSRGPDPHLLTLFCHTTESLE
jgi:hypothetical protein